MEAPDYIAPNYDVEEMQDLIADHELENYKERRGENHGL